MWFEYTVYEASCVVSLDVLKCIYLCQSLGFLVIHFGPKC